MLRAMSFAGRVAIVTGGASGIGRGVAAGLVARGGIAILADIDADAAAQAAGELGPAAHAIELDVRDGDSVSELVARTAADHGRLDYIFNNAGIAVMGEALETTAEDWDRIVDINLRGVIHGVRAAYPIMVEQGSGHIVNTASLAGLIASPGLVAYSATKHAVVGLSRSLRIEAARYGVRVSAVCPGFVRTSIVEHGTLRGIERADAEKMPPVWCSIDTAAKEILRGVERNQGVIVVTGHARALHRLERFAPRALEWIGKYGLRKRLKPRAR